MNHSQSANFQGVGGTHLRPNPVTKVECQQDSALQYVNQHSETDFIEGRAEGQEKRCNGEKGCEEIPNLHPDQFPL